MHSDPNLHPLFATQMSLSTLHTVAAVGPSQHSLSTHISKTEQTYHTYGRTRSSHKTTTYNTICILSMVEAHTHMSPCESLLGTVECLRHWRLGQLLQQWRLCNVPHPSTHSSACCLHVSIGGGQWLLWPTASSQTEGVWGGGGVLDDCNPGATDNSPNNSINRP